MNIRFSFLKDKAADIPSRDIMGLTEVMSSQHALQGKTCHVYGYQREDCPDFPLMTEVTIKFMVEQKHTSEQWIYTSRRAKDFSCSNQYVQRDRSGIPG